MRGEFPLTRPQVLSGRANPQRQRPQIKGRDGWRYPFKDAAMWQTHYPTLETVQQANFDTLNTWCQSLPPPQTDVERTIWRRLHVMRDQRAVEEVRRQAPEVADLMSRLRQKLSQATGVHMPRW